MKIVIAVVAFILIVGSLYAEKYFTESDKDGNIKTLYKKDGDNDREPPGRAVIELTKQQHDALKAKGDAQGWDTITLDDLASDGVITQQEIAEKKNEAKNKKTKDEQIKDLTKRIEALEKK